MGTTASSNMVNIGFMGNFAKYFDSPTLSDVTIRSGSESIKAHKLALSQASEYFASCFTAGFKETTSPEIELHEDDPNAVRGMIAYAYGLYYDGKHGYFSAPVAVSSSAPSCEKVKYQVDLYTVACKYAFDGLQRHIESRFPLLLRGLVRGTDYPQYLDEVARYVYVVHAETATGLQKPIAIELQKHIDEVKEEPRLRSLLIDIPELAVELLIGKCDTRSSSTTAGVKRALNKPQYEPPVSDKRPQPPTRFVQGMFSDMRGKYDATMYGPQRGGIIGVEGSSKRRRTSPSPATRPVTSSGLAAHTTPVPTRSADRTSIFDSEKLASLVSRTVRNGSAARSFSPVDISDDEPTMPRGKAAKNMR